MSGDLQNLTEEQKAELWRTYQSALVEDDQSGDEFDPTNHRGPNQQVVQRFEEWLASVFHDDTDYVLVPYWYVEDAYDDIQGELDPYAVFLNNDQVRRFVRIWLSKNAKKWTDRNVHQRNNVRAIARDAFGSMTNVLGKRNGYGWRDVYLVNEDQTLPKGCWHMEVPKRRSERRAARAANPKA